MLGSSYLRKQPVEETRSDGWGPWPGEGLEQTPWAGMTQIRDEQALRLLAVYGSVRLICDSIATLPLDVYRRLEDGGRKIVATPEWLDRPLAGFDRVAWLTQVLSSLLLDGNAYLAVTRYSETLQIRSLVPIPCRRVTVSWESGQRLYRVDGQVVTQEIVHIPGLMLAGTEVGLSPIEYARQSISSGLAAQEFGARFFSQGAVMSGVIESDAEMTPEYAAELAKRWARKHSGTSKAHLPGVLDNGAKWKATGITNEQAQFLETRKFTASEIAGQLFLVDPTDLGLPLEGTSLTYGNLESRNARRVQVTLLPWIVRLENALSYLIKQQNRYVKFNVSGLLRGDTKTRYESYAIGITNQFLTPNEARAFEDWEELPGGDEVVKPEVPEAPPGEGDDAGS